MQLVKTWSHWSRMGPQFDITGVFIKKGYLHPNMHTGEMSIAGERE